MTWCDHCSQDSEQCTHKEWCELCGQDAEQCTHGDARQRPAVSDVVDRCVCGCLLDIEAKP